MPYFSFPEKALRQIKTRRLGAALSSVALLAAVPLCSRSEATAHAGLPHLASATSSCPWLDNSLPVATRVAMLESAMTPDEEATMVRLDWGTSASDPYEGQTAAIPALCVPQITENDGSAGVGSGWHHGHHVTYSNAFRGVTQLPAPIADAAAFDPSLANSYGSVVGAEDAASGVDVALAPTVNIERNPLWGRAYESLGEDPYLSATLGISLVDGIQSKQVVAVLKHFVAYNQETARGTTADDVTISTRTLREIYLPAFSATVQQARPGGVMCSYALINSVPSCQDGPLLEGVLRDEWGYTGFVRSDCGSVFNQKAAIAVGVSQVKCGNLYGPDGIADAVSTGLISRNQLNTLVTPVLTALFDNNLIADPHPANPYGQVSTAADQVVARQVASEGTVLMKNNGLLPLRLSALDSVALIGNQGATPMPAGYGAMHVHPSSPVSVLGALRAQLGARLDYQTGSDVAAAVDAARRSDVAIIVVHDVESEGHDRTTLTLPDNQDALISAVEAVNPHTVVVLETGAPVLTPWLGTTAAVLETWYPGQEAGSSLVDLLTGAVDPSGKLPVTWPTSDSARPDTSLADFGGVDGHVDYEDDGIDVGYRWYQVHDVTPAFSFGDGLSYTTFGFSDLVATPENGGGISVSATITNTGSVKGADVVQGYVGQPPAAGEPPRQLRAFVRVSLDPGQSRRVHLQLSAGDLAHWDSDSGQWVMSAGSYQVWLGDGSDLAHLPLTATVSRPASPQGVDSGPAPTTGGASVS